MNTSAMVRGTGSLLFRVGAEVMFAVVGAVVGAEVGVGKRSVGTTSVFFSPNLTEFLANLINVILT